MTDLARRLTIAEAGVLADCEETISHGLQTFVEVGTALGLIRDNKLYRSSHPTFEAYCAERWGFTDRRARQMIEAAEIGNMFPVENSRQASALARVPHPERADVWRAANEATDGKPTAAAIRAAANPDLPRQTGELPTPGLAAANVPAVSEAPTAPTVGAGETAAGDDFPPADADGVGPAWAQGAAAAPVPPAEGMGGTGVTHDSKPNRRPLPDAFRDAAWDLVKVAERLERLVSDDRFPRNAEQVGRASRHDLLRAGDLLATVVDRVPNPMKESTE